MRTVIGTNESDELFGTEGNNLIFGRKGNDYLVGYEGNDYLNGGDGFDYIAPGAGNDIVIGGDGDDTLFDNDGGNDIHFPGQGNDGVVDQVGANIVVYEKELQGGFGNDFLDQGDFLDAGFVFNDKIIFKGYASSDAEITQNQFQTTFSFNDGSSLLLNGAGTGVTLTEGQDYFFTRGSSLIWGP